jgi:hypothetical protein
VRFVVEKVAPERSSRVERRSNTSIVALQVAGGDEKGIQYLEIYPDHSVPGGYKYGDLAFHVGGVSNLRQ